MRSRSVTALLLAATFTLAGLAGCLQKGDDSEQMDDTDDTDRTSKPTNSTRPRGNATGNATMNGTVNETTSPTPSNTTGGNGTGGNGSGNVEEETRSGTAESTNLLVLSDETEEPYDVAAGASLFVVEISVTGETGICIYDPEEECAEELTADEGENATFSATKPAAGEWIVGLTPAGLGPQEVDYTITFRVTTAGGNATGNGTSGPGPTGGSPSGTTATASSPTTATSATTSGRR